MTRTRVVIALLADGNPWKQADLAKASGFTEEQISNVFRGLRRLQMVTSDAIVGQHRHADYTATDLLLDRHRAQMRQQEQNVAKHLEGARRRKAIAEQRKAAKAEKEALRASLKAGKALINRPAPRTSHAAITAQAIARRPLLETFWS